MCIRGWLVVKLIARMNGVVCGNMDSRTTLGRCIAKMNQRLQDMSGYEGRVLELATHEWDRASTETHTKQSQLVNPG